ncbi:ubiquinone/menaquinone biosynthesis methyltransferase [Fusobacterium sp.]|uniref:ubiquinone/menaquinone biosynthesis methyltransferase n=1 Tax=Fusobacterium sp. TaxID=68766 RepID=UPI00396CFD95
MISLKKEQKSEYVYNIFQTISHTYDKGNNRISLGLQKYWKKLLIEKLKTETKNNGSVLDVCCGTGDITIYLAEKRQDLTVTGVDFSPAMLEEAKKKKKNLKNIKWICGDALSLPVPDENYSAACISFGLRNTSDYEQTLSQMIKVIKKGGTIYCLDSFVPDNILIQPFYKLYFKYIMPLLGGGKRNYKEYLWLYESTHEFLRKQDLVSLYEKLGLKEIRSTSKMFGACVLIQGKK